MKMFARILSILTLLSVFTIMAAAQSEWTGRYEFSEDGGKNAGGNAIIVSHSLEVVDNGDGLMAMLQSTGYQTSRDFVCSVKVEGKKLMIYFENYGEDNMFENNKKGDLMLTLEMKPGKDRPELLTFWGTFKPVIAKNEKNGKVYFKKATVVSGMAMKVK